MKALVLALLLSGCTGRGYVGMGMYKVDGDWDDGGQITTPIEVGYQYQITPNNFIEIDWRHYSQIGAGFPVNGEPESAVNMIGARWRFYGNKGGSL